MSTKAVTYIQKRPKILKQLYCVVKRKATPITGLCGLEGSGRLRLQITRHSAHEGGKVVTTTHQPPLPPGISWYSFLDAGSTPGCTEMSAVTD